MTPDVLRAAMHYIDEHHHPLTLALILMFLGFLRQSSVTPHTQATFDPTSDLTRGDLSPTPQGLAVTIKWAKTIQKASDLKTVLLPKTKDPLLCPVTAYNALLAYSGPAQPTSPLLTFKDGSTLTTRFIARRWTAALKVVDKSSTYPH